MAGGYFFDNFIEKGFIFFRSESGIWGEYFRLVKGFDGVVYVWVCEKVDWWN